MSLEDEIRRIVDSELEKRVAEIGSEWVPSPFKPAATRKLARERGLAVSKVPGIRTLFVRRTELEALMLENQVAIAKTRAANDAAHAAGVSDEVLAAFGGGRR